MKQLQDWVGEISVVVSSCDRFFDAWRPFAFFFRQFWPDCPFPVYLIGNELRAESRDFGYLAVGRDKGWASNMQQALRQIDTPYILYLQEDYFFTAPVDSRQLASDFAFALEEKAASFSFCDLSLLEPEFATLQQRAVLVPENSKGRTRLQAALWNRQAFAALLRPGENAWEMEAHGSERTHGLRIFSYTRAAPTPIPYLMSGIVRGLWTPGARELCRAHGLLIRPRFRPTLAATKWGRRWRRALARPRLALALAAQRGRPVNLD